MFIRNFDREFFPKPLDFIVDRHGVGKLGKGQQPHIEEGLVPHDRLFGEFEHAIRPPFDLGSGGRRVEGRLAGGCVVP